MPTFSSLPIWQLHDQIVATLRTGNRLVLVAPTGSGKTTQVPQMLADSALGSEFRVLSSPSASATDNSELKTQNSKPFRIVVLQPRRVAARTVAARVAWERDGKLGDEVGYQIRFDDRLGENTRICFVTEGVLLRWLQDDQQLSDVAAVLFDEFHERNLLSDVALALVKRLQQTSRPDLRIVVMSATLDAEPVAEYLGSSRREEAPSELGTQNTERGTESQSLLTSAATECPILVSEGISFPVEVRYAEHLDRRPTTEQAADAVERIVNHGGPGDVLVFMPGMGEINATINALRAAHLAEDCDFIPLHGDLSPEQQDLAFCPSDRRKIVVSTNVAETSVTIDGIMHVVDSGEARVARYDAERGIQTLFIEEISRASADQRKGRAGRTAPGTCWRLWTESGHLNRPERNTPEIQRADLAEVVLLLHSLGIKSAVTFDWLDKPDPAAVERAERLLVMLGALRKRAEDGGEKIEARGADGCDALSSSLSPLSSPSDLTDIGRQMLRLPMHPRYSRMLVEAGRRGCVPSAALCAALVSGRDLLMRVQRGDTRAAENRELFEASQDSDFFTLIRAFQFAKQNGFNLEACRSRGINAKVAREVEQTYRQILDIAEREGLGEEKCLVISNQSKPALDTGLITDSLITSPAKEPEPDENALLKCLTAGFIDQLAIRRDQGTLECEMTEGRQGTLMRESVVQKAPLLVAAAIRETEGVLRPLTLLGLATAVKPEWLKELYPQHLTATVTHLFDRTHKRVAAVKLARFADLVIGHEHQRETDPEASGRCLAEAVMRGWFELPNLSHEVKQFIARVNLVAAALPDLEYKPFDDAAMTAALARAFNGLTLQKEAQGAALKPGFIAHLAPEQVGWLEELTPMQIPWPTGKPAKLVYSEEVEGGGRTALSPEAQVKLQECFKLEFHPLVCEGAVPVKFWLCTPDGKRLASTCDWPHWKANEWPKQKVAVQKKFPSVTFS